MSHGECVVSAFVVNKVKGSPEDQKKINYFIGYRIMAEKIGGGEGGHRWFR